MKKNYDDLLERLRRATRLPLLQALMDEAAEAIEDLVRKEKIYAFLWNTIPPNEMETYIAMYNSGNEKGANNA